MLHIRTEQMHALEAASPPPTDVEVAERIRVRSPLQHALLGDDGVLETARVAMRQAEAHALVDRRSVFLYVELALMLGTRFDQDPLMPWAAAILQDRALATRDRVDALYRRAVAFQREAAGPLHEHLNAALRRLHGRAREMATSWPAGPMEVDRLEARLVVELRRIYPEKQRAVGDEATSAAIRRAVANAAALGIDEPRGAGIFCAFAFMLGSFFHVDPQHPWAAAALAGSEPGAARAARLLDVGLSLIARQLA